MEGFCSNDLGRTSLCVAQKKKAFVVRSSGHQGGSESAIRDQLNLSQALIDGLKVCAADLILDQ